MLEQDGFECRVMRAESMDGFTLALARQEFDLMLADVISPSFEERSSLNMAREKAIDVPFIFVSGTIGEEAAIQCLTSGATDYVLKHRLGRLIPAVRRALREVEERRSRMEAESALRGQRLESLGTLTIGMARDLNNVLAPIMLGLELLEKSVAGEAGQRILRALEKSAERGRNIVKQVLTFGQEIAGDHPLRIGNGELDS